MALYSWFSRKKTEKNRKTISVNNHLTKASGALKYSENYTMWPTATIKPDAKVILPTYSKVDENIPEVKHAILPTKTALAVIKN